MLAAAGLVAVIAGASACTGTDVDTTAHSESTGPRFVACAEGPQCTPEQVTASALNQAFSGLDGTTTGLTHAADTARPALTESAYNAVRSGQWAQTLDITSSADTASTAVLNSTAPNPITRTVSVRLTLYTRNNQATIQRPATAHVTTGGPAGWQIDSLTP